MSYPDGFEIGQPSSQFESEHEALLPSVVHAEVEFKDLPPGKIFYKKQYRQNHVTKQLVVNDEHRFIKMEARTSAQLFKIYGWVKREEMAARKKGDKNGEVAIKNPYTGNLNLIKEMDKPIPIQNGFLQPFSVNLHEIYEGNVGCKPVFELSTSDKDGKLNIFQLIIQLQFIDESFSQKFVSPIFNLRTLPTPPPSGKRRRTEDSARDQDSPESSIDSGTGEEGTRQPAILVDVLNAKTANVEKLVAKDVSIEGSFKFDTTRADLAYHLTLKDPEQYHDLEEGDIVGFYKDEESGETYIKRLRSDNIHNALHAGVVSRSHWLAGHKPLNPAVQTDTICVIGIVNVKIVGSIENGERIYASTDSPGKAIPQSHMPVGSFLRKKHVLLGMALETKKNTKKLDDVHLVKCFVCIVLDVSRKELLEEIEDLYEVNEKRTEQAIKIANKRTWRKLKGYAVSLLLIVGVVIFLLYQWLVPGSMFRYWLCRRGSIPNHEIFFVYVYKSNGRDYRVHGIQFSYERLQDKVGFKFPRNKEHNGTEWPLYYYLNVDRCAYYWANGASGNNIGGRKFVGGGRVLSAFNCTVVYELKEQVDQWVPANNQNFFGIVIFRFQ